ncbi:hypothetical protein [Streptomyces aureus]
MQGWQHLIGRIHRILGPSAPDHAGHEHVPGLGSIGNGPAPGHGHEQDP